MATRPPRGSRDKKSEKPPGSGEGDTPRDPRDTGDEPQGDDAGAGDNADDDTDATADDVADDADGPDETTAGAAAKGDDDTDGAGDTDDQGAGPGVASTDEEPELVGVGATTRGATTGGGRPPAPALPGAGAAANKGAKSVPNYLSPGVYVEEVPSAVKPIAGVGTSTAGFIGLYPERILIPVPNPNYDPTAPADDKKPTGTGAAGTGAPEPLVLLPDDAAADADVRSRVVLVAYPPTLDADAVRRAHDEATERETAVRDFKPGAGGPDTREGLMRRARAASERAMRMSNDLAAAQRYAGEGEPKLCTSFADFERYFGTFSVPADTQTRAPGAGGAGARGAAAPAAAAPGNPNGHSDLAHAVYGFFNNGGSRCWVMRFADPARISLEKFESIDEIAIVAAPGLRSPEIQGMVIDHCENMKDRFAVLDSPRLPEDAAPTPEVLLPRESNYGAVYFPDVQVFDVARKTIDPNGTGRVSVPPSGHVAGIYARVDTERGVHKAPANEVVRGALGVDYPVGKSIQAGLNPRGVNCIRDINGNIRVWGARTIGGDSQSDYKYINVRRLMLFIEESIDEGTQWVVFEPNDDKLWAKIARNVTAFLLTVWRDGALFGTTPAEAFYVKCDRTTNPPEVRDLGRVVCEIGVAPVRPAEFVIFRITQWAGPTGQA